MVFTALERRAAGLDPAAQGLVCQFGASCCLSLMGITVKLAGNSGVPVMEIVLVRSLLLLALATTMLVLGTEPAAWPWRSERRWLLLLRGCLGMGGIMGLYSTVQLLPLTDALALGFTSTVLLAAAAPTVLGEPSGRGVLAALPLCALGVVLVAQPTFLGFKSSAGAGSNSGGIQSLSKLGVAVGLAAAACVAASKLTVRLLGKTEAVATIVFSIAAVTALGSAALCALLPHHFVLPRSAGVWALLVAAGVLACAVQLLATVALKLSRATPVVLVSYVSLVWGLLADLVIFHHRPSPLSLAGAALVCASSLLVVLLERRGSGGGGGSDAAVGRQRAGLKVKRISTVDLEAMAQGWQQQQHQRQEEEQSSIGVGGTGGPAAKDSEMGEADSLLHISGAMQPPRASFSRSGPGLDQHYRHIVRGSGGRGGAAEDDRAPLMRSQT